MGNLQVVEEGQNTPGRKILARLPRNNGAQCGGFYPNMCEVFLTDVKV